MDCEYGVMIVRLGGFPQEPAEATVRKLKLSAVQYGNQLFSPYDLLYDVEFCLFITYFGWGAFLLMGPLDTSSRIPGHSHSQRLGQPVWLSP